MSERFGLIADATDVVLPALAAANVVFMPPFFVKSTIRSGQKYCMFCLRCLCSMQWNVKVAQVGILTFDRYHDDLL